MRSFFCFLFSCIRTEYGDLRSKSPYSVRIQEITDQKKLRIWTFFTVKMQGYSDQTRLCIHLYLRSVNGLEKVYI